MKPADSSPGPEPDLIELFVAPLEAAGITNYMISGAVASIEYGEPRATLDIDLVLLMEASRCAELIPLFPGQDYYLPPLEVIQIEIGRPSRGHFSIIHIPSGLKADCYPSRNHPCLDWAIRHRRRRRLANCEAWFAPPEYVILWKLEFFRESREEKHIRDIRGILSVSGDEIDSSFLQKAVADLQFEDGWKRCVS